MGKWLTPLKLEVIGDRDFKVIEPLLYRDDKGKIHTTPAGQRTDLGSVWKIPIVANILAGCCNKATTQHDRDYRIGDCPRKEADERLFESAYYEQIEQGNEPDDALRIANTLYLGVRVGGKSSYKGPEEWAD